MIKKQDRYVEQFRDSIKKFEKMCLKTFRLNKLRRHLDKREDAFIIENFDLLDLLNNLNSDYKNYMNQLFFNFKCFVSSKFSLMITIYFVKSLLISD